MKSIYTILFSFFCMIVSAQTGIGTNDNPAPSAELEVRSTTKGLLIPRLTNTQIASLETATPPSAGLMVYNLTDKCFNYFDGTSWIALPGGIPTEIVDIDSDTKVQTQEVLNDNQIRFDVDGSEVVLLNNTGLNIVSGSYRIDGKQLLTSENSNLFSGEKAGEANVSGDSLTIAGNMAMSGAIEGNSNTAIGYEAGKNTTIGSNNLFVGVLAGTNSQGINNGEAEKNTMIGSSAGQENTTGSNNIYLGHHVALSNNGSNNIIIGTESGTTSTSASNNIVIGQGLDLGATSSDSLMIGPVISGNFEDGTVYFNNAYSFPDTDGEPDGLMKLNAQDQLKWQKRVPDSVKASAADLQPADYVAMSSEGDTENMVFYMKVLSYAEAPITQITTYITSGGNGITVYTGLYLENGTRLSFGSNSLSGTDSGFLTIKLDQSTTILKGQKYYLALYTNNSSTNFKYVEDDYNPSIRNAGTGSDVPSSIANFTNTSNKNIWLRAH